MSFLFRHINPGSELTFLIKIDSLCSFNKKKKFSQKEKIFFQVSQAWVKNKLGLAYKKKGEAIIAIDFFNHSAALNLEIENKIGVATAFNNIGIVHAMLSEYDKAIEYFSKSLEIKIALRDKKATASSLANIGVVYQNIGNYDKAIDIS